MGLLEDLSFETERRVILFKSTTTMPDSSALGYNGDPNLAVNGATPGQTLIYNCPIGTRYQQDDGTQWYKKSAPSVWEQFGGGGDFALKDNIQYHTKTVDRFEHTGGYSTGSGLRLTVTEDLILTKFSAYSDGSGNATVNLREGHGMTGTILQTMTIHSPGGGQPAIFKPNWELLKGVGQYTITCEGGIALFTANNISSALWPFHFGSFSIDASADGSTGTSYQFFFDFHVAGNNINYFEKQVIDNEIGYAEPSNMGELPTSFAHKEYVDESKGLSKIQVDILPFTRIDAGIPQLSHKWAPRLPEYFSLFKFEATNVATKAVIATDLTFANETELLAWLNINCPNPGSYSIKVYYIQNTTLPTFDSLKGRNKIYSVLRGGGRYFSTGQKSMGMSWADILYDHKAAFVRMVLMDFLTLDVTGTEADYSWCLWYSSNKKKLYELHRDDYEKEFNMNEAGGRFVVYDNGTREDIGTVGDKNFRIVGGAFYVAGNPGVPILSKKDIETFKDPTTFINNYSMIKVYHLRNASGANGFMIKPVGIDDLWLNGAANTPAISAVLKVEGPKQTYYKTIPYAAFSTSNAGSFAFDRQSYSVDLATKTVLKNPNAKLMNKLSIMLNYGDGVFSAPSNKFMAKAWEVGSPLKVMLI